MEIDVINSEIISSHFESFLSLLGAKNRRENLLQSRKLIRARARPLLFCCKIHLFLAKKGTMHKYSKGASANLHIYIY